MGFFNMDDKRESTHAGIMDSIIGEKAKFKGEVFTAGSISINGEFEGRVSSEGEIIIARGSKIRGDVQGVSVIVSGSVDGNIVATQNLEISKTGRVHGDLTGGRIIIEEGSSYQGKVKVEGQKDEECLQPSL
jgi:cytoskeletal protein CcmA (bactofilin family)